MNLSPTILISSLSPKIACNLPKNSDLYFCNSKTLEVKALFNFSPKTSISKSLANISISFASKAEFRIDISFFYISISFDNKLIC